MEEKFKIRYRRLGIATIIAVFFLIFVGGLVRSTGSGMGCPDWPKCFGQFVPPTDISELPEDYKTRFAVAGKEIADFDVFKTWTEYLNRLVGVSICLLIFLTLVFSFPYLKSTKPYIFYLSLLAFLLVAFQGWIGARVVATDLAVWMITIHMLLALVIVGLLIYTTTQSQEFVISLTAKDGMLRKLVYLGLILSLIQTVSGTQVRESIDHIALMIDNRSEWINHMKPVFYVHRSLSILSMGVAFLSFYRIRKISFHHQLLYKSSLALILLMCTQAFSGAILANLGFPGSFQSIHLTLGSLTAGLQLFIAILLLTKTELIKETT